MEINSTIYVLTEGDYSDYHIVGVFTSREKAEIAQNLYPDSQIEEYDADIVPEHPPGTVAWMVEIYPEDLSNVYVSRTLPPTRTYEVHQPGDSQWSYPESFMVVCWARDAEHAQKIALDKFYQFDATRKGLTV